MRVIFLITAGLVFSALAKSQSTNYTRYVNPFIGTGGHGHTYPGATMPHGMVQLSPDTRLEGWDGCSGYHYSDSFIYGFSHTHLSGTGVSDYGDILLMPMQGQVSPDQKIYGSAFSHNKESASPGYYEVFLEDDGILASLTVTPRVGFHKYLYAKDENQYLVLDLKHRDEVLRSSIRIEDSVTVTGMRLSKSWATRQYVFFVMKFSSPITNYGIWENDQLIGNNLQAVEESKNLKAFFSFELGGAKELQVKLAISPVSVEGAKKNLMAELPGWDFNAAKAEASRVWNEELGRIDVKDTDVIKLTNFYTALYHTAIVPNINMDVDRKYRGMDDKIHTAEDFDYYSVFSLWDTYRAAHPLYTIIDQKRTLDYIKTFLAHYRQGGRLPVWELASCETDCMIGYHSIPVIVDAYMKGIRDFDANLALEAMKISANWNHLGLPAYISNGVIAVEDEHESVSKTLEYAYDDWCIAIFARELGKLDDYNVYMQRAQYYRNLYDKKTGFMRPRKNGGWLSPFEPREVNNHFTEANSWQYSFYMPHDINGYMRMIGGPKKLESKLDALFSAPAQTTGRDQSDITGLIGQYAHGNEPSHHVIYLYNFAGAPQKTQSLARKVMREMYHNAPDGLIGNEDCGQMSAWYVMSALGFYPVTPGSDHYVIGSPLFNLAEINLEDGRSFVVNAPGAATNGNDYVQNILISTTKSLRPTNWPNGYLRHSDIIGGGLVTMMMGNKPSNALKNMPKLDIAADNPDLAIVQNPVIHGGDISFKNVKTVRVEAPTKGSKVYITTDGTTPSASSIRYRKPIRVDRSMTLKAVAIDQNGKFSKVSTAVYQKMEHDWSVALATAYEPQYDAGGPDGLIDGIRGSVNWRMGNWQGYQKTDMDVRIDLKKISTVSAVTAGFLQDTRSWIVLPKEVVISVSADGVQFKNVAVIAPTIPVQDLVPQVWNLEAKFDKEQARFIRIEAKQFGELPSWHEGAGGDTHIFIDEVNIK